MATRKTERGPSKSKRAPSGERPAVLPVPRRPEVDESRLYALVRAVVEARQMPLDPTWVLEADAAERRGFITRSRLHLFPTLLGEGFVGEDSDPATARDRENRTMIKCSKHARFLLKAMAREQGVGMFEALEAIIGGVYEHRDALARAARAAGREHPWDAFSLVGRGRK